MHKKSENNWNSKERNQNERYEQCADTMFRIINE